MLVLPLLYLLLVALLAWQLRARVSWLAEMPGLPGYLVAFALTRFLVGWIDLGLYIALGWGPAYSLLSWLAIVVPVSWSLARPSPDHPRSLPALRSWWNAFPTFLREHAWFLGFATFVVARFYAGIDEDHEGQTWVVFNFVDTAFHLSVANAFLEAARFPPVDLDMPPLPLKYHFLADFTLAHVIKLGAPALRAVWLLNLLNAAALVGALWATFTRWLRLPPRWVLLAAAVFLFLNQGLINFIHFQLFEPPYFDPGNWFSGLLRYPYFNFESILTNLLEPQRALLFSTPVLLLILDLLFGHPRALPADAVATATERRRLLIAFVLICLLPFAHIVGFTVLACCAVLPLLRHARWFLTRWLVWLPSFALGCAQLYYLLGFGPPANPNFAGWDAVASMPLAEFRPLPALLQRVVFWFFVNGDFFGWGLILGAIAWWRSRRSAAVPASGAGQVRAFLIHWRWFFAVCAGFFLLINFYRYAYSWGDSNKFVFFLNLGLALLISLGAAQWLDTPRRVRSLVLWWTILLLAVAPPAIVFVRRVILYPQENNLFFHRHEIAAGHWLRNAAGPQDLVLTAAFTDAHFVTPLAAQPTPAGIYADSNPNRRPGRRQAVSDVYERADPAALRSLGVRYVCISRTERRVYRLHPLWLERMRSGDAVAFHDGEPDEWESVYIFDVPALLAAPVPPPPPTGHRGP